MESLFCPPSVPPIHSSFRVDRCPPLALDCRVPEGSFLGLLQSGNDRRRQALQNQIDRLSQASVSSAPASLWAPSDSHIRISLRCINTLPRHISDSTSNAY